MSSFGSSFGTTIPSNSTNETFSYSIDETKPQALFVNVPLCETCPPTSLLLDTGSHNTILLPSTCDSLGLQSNHIEHAERFLAGKTLEHGTQGPVNFPLFSPDPTFHPWCFEDTSSTFPNVVGMQWNSRDSPRATLMNHLPRGTARRVVVDRALGTVCVGNTCPRRKDVPLVPMVAQKGHVYPLVKTKQGALIIDTGTTYTQPLTFRNQNMTLVGWTDTDYVDIDYEHNTMGFIVNLPTKK